MKIAGPAANRTVAFHGEDFLRRLDVESYAAAMATSRMDHEQMAWCTVRNFTLTHMVSQMLFSVLSLKQKFPLSLIFETHIRAKNLKVFVPTNFGHGRPPV